MTEVIESILLPALETMAREHANASCAGTYSSAAFKSSINMGADKKPGLRIIDGSSDGVNVLAEMGLELKSFPNLLYSNLLTVGFASTRR